MTLMSYKFLASLPQSLVFKEFLDRTHRVTYPGLQGMWLSRVSFVSLNPGPEVETLLWTF